MSVHLMGEIWQFVDLPTNWKIVLLKLADHADHDGKNAWPAVERVAHESGLSKRTVQRILAGLAVEGIIAVEKNAVGGRGKTRHYRIDVDQAKRLHPLAPYESDRTSRPAASSGPKKNDTESPISSGKGDNGDPKGDSQNTKGCQSLSPEPSLTVQRTVHREAATESDQGRPFVEQETAEAKRAVQLPTHWEPDAQTVCWARGEAFDDEAIERELARFADHARTKGRACRDWNAAFRNWLRKAQDYDAERSRAFASDRRRGDGILDACARVAARRGN